MIIFSILLTAILVAYVAALVWLAKLEDEFWADYFEYERRENERRRTVE